MLLRWLPLALVMLQVCETCMLWFAHHHMQQFAKAGEHLKWRCGMVTPGVKGEVECLL